MPGEDPAEEQVRIDISDVCFILKIIFQSAENIYGRRIQEKEMRALNLFDDLSEVIQSPGVGRMLC